MAASEGQIKKENKQSTKVLEELMGKLSVSQPGDEAKGFSQEIATFINGDIEEHAAPTVAVEKLRSMLNNKKDANANQNACEAIAAIAKHSDVSPIVQPYLVELLPNVLAAVGHKMVPVKVAAQDAALSITKAVNANAVKALIPHYVNSIRNAQKWPEKMTDLECIEALAETSPAQTAIRVPDLIPIVSEAMWDTKAEVKKKAYSTMEKICQLISNKDIERFIPELIKCIAKPENVPETIHLLGATTFVTDVHEPTLAIMVPLLERGLKERETPIKRKSAVI
ncbi:Elongation factor, partial [Hortaea werneckii]